MLTAAQCTELRLPRTPIKDSERRKDAFESRHGQGATELDALEALHPGYLEQLVTAEIGRYRDRDLARQHAVRVDAYAREAQAVVVRVLARYSEQVEVARDAWQAITAAAEGWSERFSPLWDEIEREIAAALPQPVERPEPAIAEERDGALFDSSRQYLEQLLAYKAHQAGRELGDESD